MLSRLDYSNKTVIGAPIYIKHIYINYSEMYLIMKIILIIRYPNRCSTLYSLRILQWLRDYCRVNYRCLCLIKK